ncbi:putative secreted protein [Corynebacterium renale]|uniref:septum formation family protein n=1 Tax=Corynebacterium renale TaxID=1724 RepID=UPI000DA3E923|nr:septum formation family protein [Corynebacterium renale]SQG63499.1 putative secreted protein [Corynebacterium renale]
MTSPSEGSAGFDGPLSNELPARSTTWRSAQGVRALFVGAAVAAVFGISFGAFSGGDTTTASSAETTTTTQTLDVAPFTTADQGACLTWDITETGDVSNFQQAACEQPHRFEVSTRENLGTYPSSEFGANAPMPDVTRQAQLREELCRTATINYLDGHFDPVGKYSIASILPPAEWWAQGDRTMLCGVQSTNDTGNPQLTRGEAGKQDQSRVAEAGQCVAVDKAQAMHIVDCGQDHQLEVTALVNLAPVFPDHTPSIEEQDNHLRGVCTQAAIDYLGSEEALYRSTLQPFWTTQGADSWDAGSRSANCALVFAAQGGFATLTGSAPQMLIDGQPPAPQPDRRPLREG